MKFLILLLLSFSAIADEIERDVEGKIIRSHKVLSDFQKLYPCPVTNSTKGPCEGYTKDHIIPLCAGGRDTVSNLKWSEHQYALFRDHQELALCRRLKEKGRVLLDTPKEVLCKIISDDGLTLLSAGICK
jgi:hypothetical protein